MEGDELGHWALRSVLLTTGPWPPEALGDVGSELLKGALYLIKGSLSALPLCRGGSGALVSFKIFKKSFIEISLA